MIISIDLILLFFIVLLAIVAIQLRDLLSSAIVLGVYSFIMAIIWIELQAVDVGFTEASVGAGATTAFLIAAITRTIRWEKK